MGQRTSRTEFDWSYTEEPHATRRKMITKAHPEIKDLFGIDESFKYVVTVMVIGQIAACYLLRDSDWLLVFLQAYFYGGTVNHSLTLAIHEISHNAAFGNQRILANRLFGMFANLPIGVPFSVSFKKYHIEHHRYLGEDVLDTDVPTELEGKLSTSTFRKFIWLSIQALFYAFRPIIIYKKCPTDLEVLNLVIQLTFDYFVWYFCGVKGLVFLLFGTFISLGLHPTAGHFISEHYTFFPGYETVSYYGWMNMITFNVGYHVEHHDFPFIPGDKLHLVRKIAPEFYDHLPYHTSWVWVLWEFVTNPAMGPYARIKRPPRVEKQFYGTNMLGDYIDGLIEQQLPRSNTWSRETVKDGIAVLWASLIDCIKNSCIILATSTSETGSHQAPNVVLESSLPSLPSNLNNIEIEHIISLLMEIFPAFQKTTSRPNPAHPSLEDLQATALILK